MERRLKKIISEVFIYPPEEIIDELDFRSIPAWDSMTHMSFISAVETEFKLELSGEEITKVISFSSTLEVLQSHGPT